MTPEEVVDQVYATNKQIIGDMQDFSREQVLALMNSAAMRGFQFGSNVSLSMVQG